MKKRIFFDGLNLALPRGTGIATYTRVLTQLTHELGYENGVLYSSRRKPSDDPLLREIAFFDERREIKPMHWYFEGWQYIFDHINCMGTARPVQMDLGGVVVARQFERRLPDTDYRFLAHKLFDYARARFENTGGFLPVVFDKPPDIMHCTYQLPLKFKSTCNVFTIHDLVPLRLPFTTQDNKRRAFRMLKKIGAEADHIVTVSESSRRDIIDILGVDEKRVTNTYQAVAIPQEFIDRPESVVSEQLSGSFGLDYRGYLLFFGAFEPKKNISRIIDAYLSSGVDIPLVIVTSEGWGNEIEEKRLEEIAQKQAVGGHGGGAIRRQIIRFEYVSLSMLVSLIRGARALVFPSLYEGFGLPVLEAMALGTPVITARTSSLPEVAGDAALLVDPYDSDDISRAISTITHDDDLRAELTQRGYRQAGQFSLDRYRTRIDALYKALL